MFQNLKVDIVYYKTNTDFEMEFNLCGCCRMRLLTDKAPDRKTLVHSLARAVSRSRIVIVAGNLFGEDGIIKIVSSAIGSKLAVADNKAYGIDSEQDIEIIAGSTPLITKQGYFGGCIIESGPQTMILLSDNKSIRKPIMQTLIHPYVEELCAIELKEQAAAAAETPAAMQPVIPNQDEPEILPEPDTSAELEETEVIEEKEEEVQELTEEPIDEPSFEQDNSQETIAGADEENIDNSAIKSENNSEDNIILSGEMSYTTEDSVIIADEDEYDDDLELYTEPRKMRRRDSLKYNAAYSNFDTSDSPLISDEDDYFPNHRFGKISGINIPILILSALLLIAIAVICYCIFYVPAKEGVTATAFIQETFGILFG